jgi:hypothetical protein
LAVEIEIAEIEDGIVIGRVITEGGHLEVMAEAILEGRRQTLRGLNVHGVGVLGQPTRSREAEKDRFGDHGAHQCRRTHR